MYFCDSKSVVFNPSILSDKSIHHFLHSQVWDELVLGQFLACYRVKVTYPLWVQRVDLNFVFHQQWAITDYGVLLCAVLTQNLTKDVMYYRKAFARAIC